MEDFVYLFPPLLEALLAIIIALFVFNRKELWLPFSKIKKKSWLLLFLVLLAGFSARMLVVPHAHQIYYDGFAHINLAQNISNSNVFCVCQKGTDTDCKSCNARWWPAGYQTIQGIVFSLFGGSEETAFNTNAVIGSLSIILVFLLAFLVFKSEQAALWSSLLFAFIPAHLNLSGSVGMEITSLFFVLLSLVLLEICIRSKKFSVFALFLAAFSYAVQTRPENFVLVFFIPVFAWLRAGKDIKRFYSKKHFAAIAVFLLSLAVLVQVLDFRITDAPGTQWNVKTAPQLAYVMGHIAPNLLFFLWPKYNSVVFIALAFIGGAFLLKQDRKLLLSMCLFFAALLVLYSSHYAGVFPESRDSYRFSLALYIPLTGLAGYGASRAIETLPKKHRALAALALAAAFMLSLAPSAEFIVHTHHNQPMHDMILAVKEKIPDGAPVVAMSPPSIIATIRKPAVSPPLFLQNREGLPEKAVLFKDYWWYLQPETSAKYEAELSKRYSFELLAKTKVLSNEYSFFLLTKKKE